MIVKLKIVLNTLYFMQSLDLVCSGDNFFLKIFILGVLKVFFYLNLTRGGANKDDIFLPQLFY